MKILISANTFWYTFNFRLSTIDAFLEKGFEVCVAALMPDVYEDKLKKAGCTTVVIGGDARGASIFKEAFTFLRVFNAYRIIRPDVILHFTPKSNIYGTFSARALGVPCVNNISGLGKVFSGSGNRLLRLFLRYLYSKTLSIAHHTFFQNQHDHDLLVRLQPKSLRKSSILRGSGVDLKKFAFQGPSNLEEKSSYFFVGRLIEEKGARVFIEIAKKLHTFPLYEFFVLGFPDESFITTKELQNLSDAGVLTYLGQSDNVVEFLRKADCVVLPTVYGEGTPKSLIEALALGKYIITYDIPGARDTVISGVNGEVVSKGDADALMEAIVRYGSKSDSDRAFAAKEARALAERDFDVIDNIEQYFQVLSKLTLPS